MCEFSSVYCTYIINGSITPEILIRGRQKIYLLKLLKGEHPRTKKWQNCGTEVLCVMLFYEGADLTHIVNKVLGKTVNF